VKLVLISRSQSAPTSERSAVYLKIDHWNDYSFVTMFQVTVFDENGARLELGSVKIGFVGQTYAVSTYSTLPATGNFFDGLPEGYFSLGQDVGYYKTLYDNTSESFRNNFLQILRDVVVSKDNFSIAENEEVFSTSILRSVSVATIDGQFRRVLDGGAPLSDFDFVFERPNTEISAGIKLNFVVSASSAPSTNIHTIIGRNGVGKTVLLNEMIAAIVKPSAASSRFYTENIFGLSPIDHNYFSSLLSVSFSAFDPFCPPEQQSDPAKGTRYYYIGLKDNSDGDGTRLKSLSVLRQECVDNLTECFMDQQKKARWLTAIKTLESDENFEDMNLGHLAGLSGQNLRNTADVIVEKMSSGHAVVLLIISGLVAKTEEKTLVLLDEPESHLHPPLLSAFTRALSELLHNRNGLAIIATHSPVVLQEVPRSCALILTRSGGAMKATSPRIETFGENVGVLTREVFGLEVAKSGFHSLLDSAVSEGGTYEEIIEKYNGQIGLEARGILRAMIVNRNEQIGAP
jgi:predicted ATPase